MKSDAGVFSDFMFFIYITYMHKVGMLCFYLEKHATHENQCFRRLSLPTSYSSLKINMNRPDERPEDDIYVDL